MYKKQGAKTLPFCVTIPPYFFYKILFLFNSVRQIFTFIVEYYKYTYKEVF